jgi:two-component system OmpR family sensor kinase
VDAPAKPRRRHRRLFWSVYLHGVLMLIAVVVALVGIARVLTKVLPFNAYAQEYAHSLSLRGPSAWDNADGLQAELEQERARTGVAMTVRRLDGTLLATNVEPPLLALHGDRQLAQLLHEAVLSGGSMHQGRPVHLSYALTDHGHPAAYLTVAVPVLLPVAERLSLVLVGVLGVMALVSIPLARLITRPMERLTATARALGEGDLSVRSGITRRDEVGELAAAFDEMAERLQRLVRGEKELLANVSHELRTPLARIGVALDLAAEGDPPKTQRYLQEIRTDVADLERLVNDVLTAARLDVAVGANGLPPLHRQPVAAGELIQHAIQHFRECHPERALELEVAPELPSVDADAGLMGRALDNVLENAWKYSDAGMPIAVKARAERGVVTIEVQDRGIGIDPQDLPRLFTPFFRTDRSRARGTGGVGLGLALTRRIVEAHGGQVAVESAPGSTTCVRFAIPAL